MKIPKWCVVNPSRGPGIEFQRLSRRGAVAINPAVGPMKIRIPLKTDEALRSILKVKPTKDMPRPGAAKKTIKKANLGH